MRRDSWKERYFSWIRAFTRTESRSLLGVRREAQKALDGLLAAVAAIPGRGGPSRAGSWTTKADDGLGPSMLGFEPPRDTAAGAEGDA